MIWARDFDYIWVDDRKQAPNSIQTKITDKIKICTIVVNSKHSTKEL